MRAAVDRALSKCDVLVLPTMAIPPQAIGAATVDRRVHRRAAEAAHAEAHPAVQSHRASSDFASVRRDAGRIAVRASAGRTTQHTPELLQVGAQLRSVRDSTCTFVFCAPVKMDSSRLATVTMSPPKNASQNPAT